jgi:hypothetical protein
MIKFNKLIYAMLMISTSALGTNNGNNGNSGSNIDIGNSLSSYNRVDTQNTNIGVNENSNKNLNTNIGVNENSNKNLNENINKNANIGINSNSNKAYGGNARSNSNSISKSKSIATGGNSYATGGNATSSAYSGGNTQSVSIVENGNTHYSGSYDVRTVGNAPDVISYSTAPCRVAIGASGGWLGGAFGFTGSVLDEGCDVWRDVVNLTAHNYKEAADMRLCDKKELSKVLAHCTIKENTEENVSAFKVH